MAIIAGNFDLAEIIKVHKASDVGKLTAVVGPVFIRYPQCYEDLYIKGRHQTEECESVHAGSYHEK